MRLYPVLADDPAAEQQAALRVSTTVEDRHMRTTGVANESRQVVAGGGGRRPQKRRYGMGRAIAPIEQQVTHIDESAAERPLSVESDPSTLPMNGYHPTDDLRGLEQVWVDGVPGVALCQQPTG